MLKRIIVIVFILMLAILNSTILGQAKIEQSAEMESGEDVVSRLKYDMQEIWIEHAWWTHDLIVSGTAKLEDHPFVLNRLLQNQVDIGNSMKPYFGEEFGNLLTKQLKEHINIGDELIRATVNAKKNRAKELEKMWKKNAGEIVATLHSANSYWSKEELSKMFSAHLKLTSDEVKFRLAKEWEKDIKTADDNELHLIYMGEYLADGIIKKFPDKFK